ncbi:MAG: hypothetical protein AB8G86_15450 [Saprospiraceae bacterium]
MKTKIGQSNILFMVLDALRYDVAQAQFLEGNLPNFQKYLPNRSTNLYQFFI